MKFTVHIETSISRPTPCVKSLDAISPFNQYFGEQIIPMDKSSSH
uniref:Uncharacterized protein n=1 Tax=Candidatus Kentrum sp. FM TaxID=2126340 RepID=A0A450RYI3_9GAMM|nr:MAG: hypothetical protein BECKFM1743A_GA0114220_100107 [Candidatus Kentron sp. FM]VFJ44369.1 MAG: hypothetical protein BECKFM1743C_GA0114222_100107 [Candidatus Kentron sp. FM]VFK06243.1 MAG: hypothetical protein BECKFM1743B_GA0114221_100137 [Candidatus Kentron sp. FM]